MIHHFDTLSEIPGNLLNIYNNCLKYGEYENTGRSKYYVWAGWSVCISEDGISIGEV